MKKGQLIIDLSIVAGLLSFNLIKTGTHTVDVKASQVTWMGSKIAYGHKGSVDLKSGSLIVENGTLTGGSFEIDMTTIKNLDLTDEEKNAKLVGHLKSKDFFNVKKHPSASFEITSAKQEQSEGGNYMISGDLTIKGTTEPLSFPAQVDIDGDKVTAKANMKFDRSKYDVRYGSGSFFDNLGDKLINDDIEMGISLVASQ